MFKGFKKKFVKVNKGKIFCRLGGKGPPLLLLHGYPQTHIMWHKIVNDLSKSFTIIAKKVRGMEEDLMKIGYSDNDISVLREWIRKG